MKCSKVTQKCISESDIKWSHELGKYQCAFYKIDLLRMDHKIGSRLTSKKKRKNLISSPNLLCPFLRRTTPATKMRKKSLLQILIKRW